MKRVNHTCYLVLLTLAALLAGGVWAWFLTDSPLLGKSFRPLPWAIGLTASIPLLAYKLNKQSRQYARQVLFLLDAVENNDYAVHFSEDERDTDTRLVHQALNRISHLLYNVKNETAQREKYYELILECVSTGIVVLNDNGAVYQKNNEALRLLGLEVFTHVRQLKRIDPRLANRFATCRAGDTFQLPLQNERGTLHLFVRASDITIRQEHLRILALNDINNELDEKEIDSWIRLTRVLTHEIMNSVTPITSLSETLLELAAQEGTQEEISRGLETISQTGKGLLAFVESYRQFTRIPTPIPSLFYVKSFLERMVNLARHQYPGSNTSFRTEVQPDDLILHADENLIGQVITNLLKNALQAIDSEKGRQTAGLVSLRAYCDDDEAVIIDVSNDGPAIPEDVAGHIFIPFFTTKDKGSGIGLSISRQIMRLSGGSITLLPGRETTFRLKFD